MRITTASMLLAAALSGGCHTMRQMTLEELAGARPARAWVTRSDQSVLVIEGPQVFRGKLVGFVGGRYREMAAADLHRIRVRQLATTRTAALIVGSAVGAAVVVVMISGREPTAFDPCLGSTVDCEP